MFKKIIFKPIEYLVDKTYFARLRATEHIFKNAVKIYNEGDKQKSLLIFRELVNKNQSDKASRYWMGRITGELQQEEKEVNTNSFKK